MHASHRHRTAHCFCGVAPFPPTNLHCAPLPPTRYIIMEYAPLGSLWQGLRRGRFHSQVGWLKCGVVRAL